MRDEGDGESAAGGRKIEYALFGLLGLAVVTLLYREFSPAPEVMVELSDPVPEQVEEETVREVLPNSVAVLPFENLSLDPENAFFAAGIHDTILNELAKISGMNVIARTSVMRYADGQKPLEQIAEELNVETIMEGTVQYADDQTLHDG